MAILSNPLQPITSLSPIDPTSQKLAELEARIAKLEGVLQIVGTDVTLKTQTAFSIEAGAGINVKGGQAVIVESGTSMTLKSQSATTVQSAVAMTVQTSGSMTIKGATVAIN